MLSFSALRRCVSVLVVVGITFAFLLAFHGTTKAQIPTDFIEPLSIRVLPEYPRSFQDVEVSVESYSLNLNALNIAWFLNGELIVEDIGVKSIIFTTGGLGSVSEITMIVRDEETVLAQKSLAIAPANIDIMWQAKTYTPPFYRGKALPSGGSLVDVVALPSIFNTSGRNLRSSELIYTWEFNGTVLGEYSGSGRDILTIAAPIPGAVSEVKVTASSRDGLLNATGKIFVESIEPKVIVYENDPLLGIGFQSAITDTFTTFSNELAISAYPYFFSTDDKNSNSLDYNWGVDGEEVVGLGPDKTSLIIESGGSSGSVEFNLEIQHLDAIFQAAQTAFSVIFNGNENI